jgi:hypothetical protein
MSYDVPLLGRKQKILCQISGSHSDIAEDEPESNKTSFPEDGSTVTLVNVGYYSPNVTS